MKLVKKYLFPILTCLIVAGAVVLPPYISHIRDYRQFFRQIHTSELDAEALPVWEGRDLLERLELYARWHTLSDIIPSFQIGPDNEDPENVKLAEQTLSQALNHLARAGVIPDSLLKFPLEHAGITRILLWDPADSMNSREPLEFWSVTADWGDGSLWITVDSESGLPLVLNIYDPNMAQWLSDKAPDTLPNLAERFFDLLDLEAEMVETDIPLDAAAWNLYFVIEGTEIRYWVTFSNPDATMLDISLTR